MNCYDQRPPLLSFQDAWLHPQPPNLSCHAPDFSLLGRSRTPSRRDRELAALLETLPLMHQLRERVKLRARFDKTQLLRLLFLANQLHLEFNRQHASRYPELNRLVST